VGRGEGTWGRLGKEVGEEGEIGWERGEQGRGRDGGGELFIKRSDKDRWERGMGRRLEEREEGRGKGRGRGREWAGNLDKEAMIKEKWGKGEKNFLHLFMKRSG
jgi:hypothetical protein